MSLMITKGKQLLWVALFVHASPITVVRKELWSYLQHLGECIGVSWLVVGDFNQILSEDDKRVIGRIERRGYGMW